MAAETAVEWNCFVPECVSFAVDEIERIIFGLVRLVQGMRQAGMGEIQPLTRVVYHYVETLASMEPEGLRCLCDARRHDFRWDEIELDDSDEVVESKARALAKAIIEQVGVVHPHRSRCLRGVGLEFTLDGKEHVQLHRCRWVSGHRDTEW